TLHFVRPDDLPWMLELTGRRMARSAAGRHRQLELDEQQFDRAERIARERLDGGATVSRAELLEAFAAGGVPTTGQRGAHLLVQLAHTAVTVLVGQSEYALLAHRVPTPRVLEPDEALREFALRYFLSHGPATIQDFAWWSSLTLTDARAGLAAAREQLDELEVGGTRYYLPPGLEPAGRAVHLLPGFDEYLLGYSDRRAPLSGAGTEVIVPGGNGMFLSTIVVNGEVVGSWRRAAKANRVELTTSPFAELSATTRSAIGRAAERYGRYLEQPIEVDPNVAKPR
ncbi:MAG: winged helix DNA-binding domain-containing protein, partial [Actinomycetota bacterium]|nr:winged helix DNA-binding domain-containing protein [Actinomycetota bacterium]